MTTDQITPETTDTETTPERFWFQTDYQRAAAMLRRARHVKCQSWTPASPAKQAAVDGMAALMAAVFEADAPQGTPEGFDPERFMAGTHPYAAPVADETDTDETDDDAYTVE